MQSVSVPGRIGKLDGKGPAGWTNPIKIGVVAPMSGVFAIYGQRIKDGIEALAEIAFEVNRTAQNIGARRLHTILERVAEEVSFDGPDLKNKQVKVDAAYVRGRLADVLEKEDLSKFIL